MYVFFSDERKYTNSAISLVLANLPKGINDVNSFISFWFNDSKVNSVSVKPGKTLLIKIFFGPNSMDKDFVIPLIAYFVDEYNDLFSFETNPKIDDILTILEFVFNLGRIFCIKKYGAFMFTSKILLNSLSDTSPISFIIFIPALFIKTSKSIFDI